MRTLATTCLLVSLALGAPAPKPQPKKVPAEHQLLGHWKLVWSTQSHIYHVRFCKDRVYICWRDDDLWHGTWRYANGVLTVSEQRRKRHLMDVVHPCTWSVALRVTSKGTLYGDPQPVTAVGVSFQRVGD